jgi:hypothetical protein
MEILMKSILDPTFHYVPSAATDVRKTFVRIRREMEDANERSAQSSGGHPGPLARHANAPADYRFHSACQDE